MVVTLIVVAGVVAVALAAATVARRRGPDAPTAPSAAVPSQLDRRDFDLPDRPWLVALFTSATCLSCADARAAVERIDQPGVVVQEVAFETRRALHERYSVDTVPVVLLADADGVVRWSSVGPPSAHDVARALAEAGAS